VTLWIVVGVVAIAVLGFVCSWVLNARGGLEAAHPMDRWKSAAPEADEHHQAGGMPSRRHGSA
jgi:hypothetical protein